MLSKKYLRILAFYLRLPSFSHSIPWFMKYDKNAKTVQLVLRKDQKSNLLWLLNFLCQLETVSYSFLRLIPKILNSEYDSMDKYVMHSFNIIGWGIPVYYSCYLFLYGEQLSNFFNRVVKMDQQLREKYFRKRSHLNVLELGFCVVLPSCYLQGISFALFSLFCPHLPFFHCSFFTELGWPLWAQIPIKMYETLMLINCWNVIAPAWLIWLTPGFSGFGWTHELPTSPRLGFKFTTDASLREPRNSLKVYRYIQLQGTEILSLVKHYMLGVSFLVGGIVVVFMGYASVRELGETPMPQYLAYPTSWMFVVLIFSFVGGEAERWNESSIRYIQGMKNAKNKAIRKGALSLWPFMLKISNVEEAKRGFTLSKMNEACDIIIDLLVSS